MSRRRCLLLGMALAVFMPLQQAAPVQAQMQAMPFSTAPAEPQRAYPSIDSQRVYPSIDPQAIPSGPMTPAVPMQPLHEADNDWSWQVLPAGLIWHSYLAAQKDSRIGSQWVYEKGPGWFWDAALGGRVGLLRYGTNNAAWPEGFQVDLEGAAFPRLDDARSVISTDFRIGSPLTWRVGPWETKIAYQHECSHLGDLYMEANPGAHRINYVRDTLVAGAAYRPIPAVRIYSEVGWAFHVDGGAQPWEFQFGVDYSPLEYSGFSGSPFVALNGRIRQELNFGGGFTAETGWQWRGELGQLFRVGAIYFNGKSNQYQFYQEHEQQVGIAAWYDF